MASITKLPSGRHRALVRRKGHKPLSATFSEEKHAIAWAKEQERKLEEVRAVGKATPTKGSTVAMYVDAFIEHKAKRNGLQRTALNTLKNLKKVFGGTPLASLTQQHIRTFSEKRINDGIAGVTIAGDLSMLSSVLRYCADNLQLHVDGEMANRERIRLREEEYIKIKSDEFSCIPSDGEVEKIIAGYSNSPRNQIDMPDIIRFAVATGMRQSEICRILIEDLDLEKRAVKIRDRKHPTEKIGNHEDVPLPPEAFEIVKRRIEGRASGAIFPYKSKSVGHSYMRMKSKLNITTGTRFHDLRHKAITDFFRLGLSVPLVALMSGHRDWQTLKRYTHITAEDFHFAHAELTARKAKMLSVNDEIGDIVDKKFADLREYMERFIQVKN